MSRYKNTGYEYDLTATADDDDGDNQAVSSKGKAAASRARKTQQANVDSASDSNIFTVDKDDGWRPDGVRVGNIRLAAAGGTVLYLNTNDGNVIRWDSSESESCAELVELRGGRPEGGRVHSIFVDPTGQHALMCVVSSGIGTCYYCYHTPDISSTGTRPVAREMPSLRGQTLDCVAWGRDVGNKTGTGNCPPFLLGTSSGRVLEVKGLSGEERKDKGVGKLWDAGPMAASLGGGEGASGIASLRWDISIDGTKHVILVVTGKPTRLYQFSGGPTVSDAFTSSPGRSRQGGGQGAVQFQEVRGDLEDVDTPSPSLAVHRMPAPYMAYPGGKPTGKAQGDGFVVLTGAGLYMGRITLATALPPPGSKVSGDGVELLHSTKIIPYPVPSAGEDKGGGGRGGMGGAAWEAGTDPHAIPTACCMTDFHVLLRYKGRVLALSRLTPGSGGVVWEQALPEDRYGALKAVLPTGLQGAGGGGNTTLWLVAERAVLKVTVRQEGRNAWQSYIALKDFESAKAASGGEAGKMEAVYEAMAEHMFQAGDVAGAAEAFARTSRPFEESCLRLLAGGHRAALRAYLAIKLDQLGASATSAGPQRTILCTWLLELYLDRINTLVVSRAGGGEARAGIEAEYEELCGELKAFLRERLPDLHAPTTRALLAGHGRTAELLMYSRLTGDWARIVAHYISTGQWSLALQSIKDAPTASELAAERREAAGGGAAVSQVNPNPPTGSSQEDLWYRYSSLLMPLLPKETVAGWKACLSLDPLKLLPTMVRYEQLRATAGALPPPASTAASAVTGATVSSLLPSIGLTAAALAHTLDASMLYLEWVIEEGLTPKGKASAPLHNLLLALYAWLPTEELLRTYVEQQLAGLPPAPPAGASAGLCSSTSLNNPAVALAMAGREADNKGSGDEEGEGEGEEEDGPKFDIPYALRVCLQAGRKCLVSTVRLYCALGLYVEGVETALGGPEALASAAHGSLAVGPDVELAKEAANAPPKEEEFLPLRKRLWVRIATHVIAAGAGAQGALSVLHESGVLGIEDVLPYFPGSTTLGVFKEEVTDSLREADGQITRLRSEMRGYTQAAERIRGDIKALRSRCGTVRVGQKCDLCKGPVLSRHFYLFPCAHAYHSDCLLGEAVRHMTSAGRKRVAALHQLSAKASALLTSVSDSGLTSAGLSSDLSALGLSFDLSSASAGDVTAAVAGKAEEVQASLDKAVAGECILCGEAMIESVVVPLGQEGAAGGGHDGQGEGEEGEEAQEANPWARAGGPGEGKAARRRGSSAAAVQALGLGGALYRPGGRVGNGRDEDWAV